MLLQCHCCLNNQVLTIPFAGLEPLCLCLLSASFCVHMLLTCWRSLCAAVTALHARTFARLLSVSQGVSFIVAEGNLQAGVKEAKLRAKQVQELEVLQARGAKGKEQLKRAHAQVLAWQCTLSLLGMWCTRLTVLSRGDMIQCAVGRALTGLLRHAVCSGGKKNAVASCQILLWHHATTTSACTLCCPKSLQSWTSRKCTSSMMYAAVQHASQPGTNIANAHGA